MDGSGEVVALGTPLQGGNEYVAGNNGRPTDLRDQLAALIYSPASLLPTTMTGRITLALVVVQAIIIIAIQSSVSNRFIQLVDVSQPGPARGVPVYLAIFTLGQVFQFYLCWDALFKQNTMQTAAFVLFNFAIFLYSIFQYAQLSRIAGSDPQLQGPLIAIPVIIGIFELIFAYLASRLYVEFGWSVFKRIGADPSIRNMYRFYQIFVLLVKLDVFFVMGFCIQFLVLVIKANDPEFALTIIAIPIMIVILAVAVYAMRTENKSVVSAFMFGLILATTYFIFKLVRIYTQKEKYEDTKYFLTFFASLSLAMVIATFGVGLVCISNFGRGLRGQI